MVGLTVVVSCDASPSLQDANDPSCHRATFPDCPDRIAFSTPEAQMIRHRGIAITERPCPGTTSSGSCSVSQADHLQEQTSQPGRGVMHGPDE